MRLERITNITSSESSESSSALKALQCSNASYQWELQKYDKKNSEAKTKKTTHHMRDENRISHQLILRSPVQRKSDM